MMRPLAPIERWLLRLIALSCLLFCVVTPPFQVPDEPQHFTRSVRLTEGKVFAEKRGVAIGGLIERRFADLSQVDFPREPFGVLTRYRPADLAHAATLELNDAEPLFVEFANVANYAPSLYLPQAVGVTIGKAIGASPLTSFYLARLVNAFAFLGMLWAAVRVMPFGRLILLAVAALPTTAYQAASVSPDATINGLGWLVLALSLAVGYSATENTLRGTGRHGWLVAVSIPLGLCKGLYAPLALAGARGRSVVWCAIAFVAAAGTFVIWTAVAGTDQAVYVIESRVTGQLVSTVPLREQLAIVCGDPLRYVRVLASSMAERSPVYVLQLVGRFGWNAFLLPLLAYPLAAVMLATSVLAGLGRPVPAWVRWWWLALGFGMIVLVETALYLTGTPRAADYVQGTQGRYFLPVLPLLLVAAAPVLAVRWRRARFEHSLFVAAVTLHIVTVASVADAFWLHGFATGRGLPPLEHDTAGIVRALLLPSPRW